MRVSMVISQCGELIHALVNSSMLFLKKQTSGVNTNLCSNLIWICSSPRELQVNHVPFASSPSSPFSTVLLVPKGTLTDPQLISPTESLRCWIWIKQTFIVFTLICSFLNFHGATFVFFRYFHVASSTQKGMFSFLGSLSCVS